jgi:hypothetical protein
MFVYMFLNDCFFKGSIGANACGKENIQENQL